MAVRELDVAEARSYRRRGHLARAMTRLARKKLAIVSIVTLLVLYIAGFSANWTAPYGYSDLDFGAIRTGPSIETGQGVTGLWTGSHLAGTDRAGRDVLTRVMWGLQNTAILTLVGMLSGGLLIGVSLGLISGYFGKKVDAVIMRTGEVSASFPDIFLVIIIAATLSPRVKDWVRSLEDNTSLDGLVRSGIPDYIVISIALVSFSWIGMARLVRGQILYLKETQQMEAARAIGASTPRILFIHLLPNAISPIVVTVSFGMGAMAITEIILSWLGLGIQPPRPSLGSMMFEGASISALRAMPWMLLAPGAAAWMMILSWNLLGDALNDVLNPRTR